MPTPKPLKDDPAAGSWRQRGVPLMRMDQVRRHPTDGGVSATARLPPISTGGTTFGSSHAATARRGKPNADATDVFYQGWVQQRKLAPLPSIIPKEFWIQDHEPFPSQNLALKSQPPPDPSSFSSGIFAVTKFPKSAVQLANDPLALRDETHQLAQALDGFSSLLRATRQKKQPKSSAPQLTPVTDDLKTVAIAAHELARMLHSHCAPVVSLLEGMEAAIHNQIAAVHKYERDLALEQKAKDVAEASAARETMVLQERVRALEAENKQLSLRLEGKDRSSILQRLEQEYSDEQKKRAAALGALDESTLERIRDAPSQRGLYSHCSVRLSHREKKVKHPVEQRDIGVDCCDLFFPLPATTARGVGKFPSLFTGGTFEAVSRPSTGTLGEVLSSRNGPRSKPEALQANSSAASDTVDSSTSSPLSNPSTFRKSKKKAVDQALIVCRHFPTQTDPPPASIDSFTEVGSSDFATPTATIATMTEAESFAKRLSIAFSNTFNSVGKGSSPSTPYSPVSRRSTLRKTSVVSFAGSDEIPAVLQELLQDGGGAVVRPIEWLNATLLELWVFMATLSLLQQPSSSSDDASGEEGTSTSRPQTQELQAFFPVAASQEDFKELQTASVPELIARYFRRKFGISAGAIFADFLASCQAWASQSLRCSSFLQMVELQAVANLPHSDISSNPTAVQVHKAALMMLASSIFEISNTKAARVSWFKLQDGSLEIPIDDVEALVAGSVQPTTVATKVCTAVVEGCVGSGFLVDDFLKQLVEKTCELK